MTSHFRCLSNVTSQSCVSQMYIYTVEHHRMCLQGAIVNKLSSLTGLSWGNTNNPCCKCRLQTLWETFTNRINWAVLKHGVWCYLFRSPKLRFFFYLAFGKAIFKVKNQSSNKLPQNVYNCYCVFLLFKNLLSAYMILRVNIRPWIKLIYSISDCFAFY